MEDQKDASAATLFCQLEDLQTTESFCLFLQVFRTTEEHE